MRVPPEEIKKETTNKLIVFYICTTPGCTSSTMVRPEEKLEESWTGPKSEDASNLERGPHGSRYRHTRAECPDCRTRGLGRVMRVRMEKTVAVPVIGPTPPPLPGPTGRHHEVAKRSAQG